MLIPWRRTAVAARTAEMPVPIFTVDRNQRYPHGFAQERIVEQLLLGHDRSAARNQWQHDGRIDVGYMVGHENVVGLGSNRVESYGSHAYAGQTSPG